MSTVFTTNKKFLYKIENGTITVCNSYDNDFTIRITENTHFYNKHGLSAYQVIYDNLRKVSDIYWDEVNIEDYIEVYVTPFKITDKTTTVRMQLRSTSVPIYEKEETIKILKKSELKAMKKAFIESWKNHTVAIANHELHNDLKELINIFKEASVKGKL